MLKKALPRECHEERGQMVEEVVTYKGETNHKSLHDGGHCCWRVILGGGVTGAGLLGGVSWGKESSNSCQCSSEKANVL